MPWARLATVPDDILEPPVRRGFCHDDAAPILDAHLHRLARAEAHGRLVLGQLASAFLRRRGHRALGFTRLDDWTRERLGISGRELQSLATVARRADALPAVTTAFKRGELSWAQLRLLVGFVTPDMQAEWLSIARGRTVRALEALIRQASHAVDSDEDEPRVYLRMRCPRRVRRLWHRAVELARRTAGAHVSHAAAAELIAAEGSSAGRALEDPAPDTPPGAAAPVDPHEMQVALSSEIDWSEIADAIPRDLTVMAAGCERLDAFALDSRMRAVVNALNQTAWQTGRLLRLFLDRRLFLQLGFRSASLYLRERIGLSERKARALVAVERRTWSAPAFGDAYRAGQLSWVRALMLLPVITERSAGAWVDRACHVSVRRLGDEVEWTLAGRAPYETVMPPPLGAPLEVERQMCAPSGWEPTDSDVRFAGPPDVVALFRSATLAFARPHEPLWRGLERLLDHVIAEWEGQPTHRDPIFARDGWRCTVPACSSRRNLHDHHVLFRSRGGSNARMNRITVCAAHHLHGIHAGIVRAWGEAPDGMTWELGVRPGRAPLLRFGAGEVYLSH